MTKKRLAEIKTFLKNARERHSITGKPMHPDWKIWVQSDGALLLDVVGELLNEIEDTKADK